MKWLAERNYDVICGAAMSANDDFKGLNAKARNAGAKKCITELTEEFVRDFVFPAIA